MPATMITRSSMDVDVLRWKDEMETMLEAINRQTAHSLRVMRLIFKRCGRSLPPEFKQYFLQTSNNCIKSTYEEFELNSLPEEPLDVDFNSLANVAGGSLNNGQSELSIEAGNDQNDTIQSDGLDDEDVVAAVSSTPVATDGFCGTNEPIVHQTDPNERCINDKDASKDSNFAVEINESNDSIKMLENQNNRVDETTSAERIERKGKSTRIDRENRNNSNKQPTKTATEVKVKPYRCNRCGRRFANATKLMNHAVTECTVCGYNGSKLKRHMRTHTGEKPYGCDRCEKRFTNTQSLKKHTATHIADFPFHCRICFQGFSVKAEATAHERQCQKRRYECHLCKKFFTCVKSQLIAHMRTHSGVKPFRCEICMQRFSQKTNLQQHLNIIHTKTS